MSSSTDRIAYLDALRSFCLALVVPLHAYYLGFDGYVWVALLSDSFHMAAFFLLSGFFAAASLARRGMRGFARERLRSLGLPLLAILFVLNLPTLAMHQVHTTGGLAGFGAEFTRQLASGKILLHGWFLVALLIYVAATPELVRCIAAPGWHRTAARLVAAIPAPLRGLAALALVTVLAAPAEVLWDGQSGPLGLPLFVYETLRYAWAYGLGLIAWHHRAVFDSLHRVDPLVLVVALASWLWFLAAPPPEGAAWDLAYALRRSACALVLIPACLWLFRALVRRPTRLVRALSEAGYTTYVLQWITLYALALLLPIDAVSPHLAFWGLTALTLAAGFAAHHLLVARLPVLAWILNGRPLPQAGSKASTPSTAGRWRAISDQVSPPSILANTDPVLVPK